MRTSSQLLLTFLLNAVWQIAFIAALASFGAWLLRHSAMRYQHWLWVAALCLSLLVPLGTALRALPESPSPITEPRNELSIANPVSIRPIAGPFERMSATPVSVSSSAFQLNSSLAVGLLIGYLAVFLFSSFRLARAWYTTRTVRHDAATLERDETVEAIVRECAKRLDFEAGRVKVCRSMHQAVPVTIGLFRPIIILPDSLLRGGDDDLLTSAIGHEFIHVARHDYVLNFLYELLVLPVSFHPATALLRRRIRQTRELCCDELVAERILNAEVYARSLVALASSAPPLRRLSVTTTVGIADADILEARIMSLLSKPKMNRRWKKLLLVAVSLLLLVPSFAAAAFAMRFELAPNVQEPSQQEKELKEKRRAEEARTEDAFKERMAHDPNFRREVERKREVEMEMREVKQAALVRLARVNMDQAIQIATSQTPGKVLECSLNADKWEEPGKLAKDGVVFYHVVIADETSAGATHVLVNAVDGLIMKTEKELPHKQRNPENQ
ncbi:MAG TPA: M56 family metallopeptidase [Pyrinomonadaceae bacterium]|jgi:beta-lactamase regulating signal transducer with metallopeptidase domain